MVVSITQFSNSQVIYFLKQRLAGIETHICLHVFVGSPWRVDVLSAAQWTVVGAGVQVVPINVPAWFEVRSNGSGGCPDGALLVNITGKLQLQCHYLLPAHDTKINNLSSRVEM